MRGGLTVQEMDLRKKKAENLDAALAWLEGRFVSEDAMTLRRILLQGLQEEKSWLV